MEPTEKHIHDFFERIERNKNTLADSGVPSALADLVTKEMLKNIYDFVSDVESKDYMLSELKNNNKIGPWRFAKEESLLGRTLNVIADPISGELQLILETKSKIIKKNRTIKADIPVFSGANKDAKPAWRIDTLEPVKMANVVFYAIDEDEEEQSQSLQQAVDEALFPKKAIEGKNLSQKEARYLNISASGPVIDKPGVRLGGQGDDYYKKQSSYSPYAIGNLTQYMKDNPTLSVEEINGLVENLLMGVKLLHDAGIIHQDIKPDNILVFKNEKGEPYLQLIDFGLTVESNMENEKEALATYGYESPEISLAHSNKKDELYAYFHKQRGASEAKIIASSMPVDEKVKAEYGKPNKANDMWAVGQVIKKLYGKNTPPNPALIQNLLAPKRAERWTVDQAIETLHSSNKERLISKLNQHFQNDKESSGPDNVHILNPLTENRPFFSVSRSASASNLNDNKLDYKVIALQLFHDYIQKSNQAGKGLKNWNRSLKESLQTKAKNSSHFEQIKAELLEILSRPENVNNRRYRAAKLTIENQTYIQPDAQSRHKI